jgi:beta-galactosidase
MLNDQSGAATTTVTELNTDWLFGGAIPRPGTEDSLDPEAVARFSDPQLDDAGWEAVTLPHTVAKLSWRSWNPPSWEKVWAYRRHVTVERTASDSRVFVDFGAAMTNATVVFNGTVLGEHRGGYLPFAFEITDLLSAAGDNILAVVLDSRFTVNVPPNAPAPAPTSTIDYLQPGGLHRAVTIREVPQSYVRTIGLTHHDVLDPRARRSTVVVTLDSAVRLTDVTVAARLVDAKGSVVGATWADVQSLEAGSTAVTLELTGLDAVALWDTNDPVLYRVEAELRSGQTPLHIESVRTGYREARFEEDGFFLNGERRYLMGVNRHGYFPFAGFAMPDRVHRRDAEIIKNELNCVMVRCSHYPQTASFLDACDELGLLVWEESPGWQYVGDSVWQDQAVSDIEHMIERDRHRPSIIVWGARLNETPDRPEFYARTEALVKRLDPSRATSGTMFGDYARTAIFQHDVFGYDDYTTALDADGERYPVLLEPIEGRPYLVSEGISTRSSPTTFYLRNDPPAVQQHQALDYAMTHDVAMGDKRFAGLLAWVGFDYQANMGNHHRGIKTSGLGDVFRVLKPGAAIYRSQVDPAERVVIEPAFSWDPPEFGQPGSFDDRPEHRLWGPGAKAMICSNCDRLDVYLGDRLVESVRPDRKRFPNLPYAPSFVDLRLLPHDTTDLRIDGFVGDERVGSTRLSGDRSGDSLALVPDDTVLFADGSDATRVTIAVIDRFGRARGKSQAIVEFELEGPGVLVGDTTLDLQDTGGVGAVWVRTLPGKTGTIVLHATSFSFGAEVATIQTITSSQSGRRA